MNSPAANRWTMSTMLRCQLRQQFLQRQFIAVRTGFARGKVVLRKLLLSLKALRWKEAIADWLSIQRPFMRLPTDLPSPRVRGNRLTAVAGGA